MPPFKNNQPLKLKAEDKEDLSIISSMLQDALIPMASIHFIKDQGIFTFISHRFKWELDTSTQKKHERIESFVQFSNVEDVQMQNIASQKDPNHVMSLLTMTQENNYVILTFSGGGVIRLNTYSLCAYLGDGAISWPTIFFPTHSI